jgi:hypothetical protein
LQVSRALQLVANGNMTFDIIQESRGKRAKGAKTDDGTIWTPVITAGEQFAFSKPVWGYTTTKFLEPIMALSDADFASIVEEAYQYAKHGKSTGKLRATSSATSAPDDDDDFADLFAYR